LEEMGAIVLGKTNTPEVFVHVFAWGGEGKYGVCVYNIYLCNI
jgi:hypothetical protein